MTTTISQPKFYAPAKSLSFPLTFGVLNFTLILVLYFIPKEHWWPLSFIDVAAIFLWLLSIGYYSYKWTRTSYILKDGILYYQRKPTSKQHP